MIVYENDLGEGIYSYGSDVLSVGQRIYPATLPQGAVMPAMTYQEIGDLPLHHHGGPDVMWRNRVQFDTWGETADDARALFRELKAYFDGFNHGFWGDVWIESCQFDFGLLDYVPTIGRWRRITHADISYKLGGGSGS